MRILPVFQLHVQFDLCIPDVSYKLFILPFFLIKTRGNTLKDKEVNVVKRSMTERCTRTQILFLKFKNDFYVFKESSCFELCALMQLDKSHQHCR